MWMPVGTLLLIIALVMLLKRLTESQRKLGVHPHRCPSACFRGSTKTMEKSTHSVCNHGVSAWSGIPLDLARESKLWTGKRAWRT
jgi:hypothetical protein